MAQKRMFSLSVTDTDTFLDMPTSAQALYFHLGMHGDDDGFVGSPRKIMRAAGCNEDDAKLLAAKGYIIIFENGIIVIRDWRINNTLKNDRYHATIYQTEKSSLAIDKAGKYCLQGVEESNRNRFGTMSEPEHNITQRSITESQPGTPGIGDVKVYMEQHIKSKGLAADAGKEAEAFIDHYGAVGWIVSGSPVKDWRALARSWLKNVKQFSKSTSDIETAKPGGPFF